MSSAFHHPGFSPEGYRVWPSLEFCPENLAMRIQYKRENAHSVSRKCRGVTEDYIHKLLAGDRTNPTIKVIRELEYALECFWLVI